MDEPRLYFITRQDLKESRGRWFSFLETRHTFSTSVRTANSQFAPSHFLSHAACLESSPWSDSPPLGHWQLIRPRRRGKLSIGCSKGEGFALSIDSIARLADPSAIREGFERIRRAISDGPALAVGSAKELIESTAKVVLTERGQPFDDKSDLSKLARAV
jgi:hypothetical protein